MTCIAYRAGILAADSQANLNSIRLKASKILQSDSCYYAMTGNLSQGKRVAQWHMDGAKPEDFPYFRDESEFCRVIVATPAGVYWYEGSPAEIVLQDDYFAWGSGQEIALGAMFMGADAATAVRASIHHCSDCGGDIDVVHVKGITR